MIKYKIDFTSKAQSDYYNIMEKSFYIHFNYYQKIREEFHSKIQNILENPHMYPVIQIKDFRKASVDTYIIIYKIHMDTVIIQRIFSSKISYTEYL